MDQQTIENFKKKHVENYKNAVLETLKNNSNALFDDDIFSLLQKPPLDSMDLIKCKILELAKKYSIVIQNDSLNNLLDDYRNSLLLLIPKWKKIRLDPLNKIINQFKMTSENTIIKINKKDFIPINRNLKKIMKEDILNLIDKKIVNCVNQLFTKNIEVKIKNIVINEIIKYTQKTYIKQLLDNIDFKIIVKDTTLINGIREHGERFIFTKANSYLLNEKISS